MASEALENRGRWRGALQRLRIDPPCQNIAAFSTFSLGGKLYINVHCSQFFRVCVPG